MLPTIHFMEFIFFSVGLRMVPKALLLTFGSSVGGTACNFMT